VIPTSRARRQARPPTGAGRSGCATETWATRGLPEKALLAGEGAVDELVDDHEIARRHLFRNDPQAETEITSVTPSRFSASILAR
jgi:hypothetical protein